MAITAITAIPNNDHKIYFDKSKGFIFERTATIFAYDDETKKTIALYAESISTKGEEDVFTDDLEDYDDYNFELLGTRGDTVTPRQIESYLYSECEPGYDGIYEALYCLNGRYLHIDNSKAEDTVRISIQYHNSYDTGAPSFFLIIKSDWFTFAHSWETYFHLSEFNDNGSVEIIEDNIIKPFIDYAKWLGRLTINIKLCPEWYTDADTPEEECDKINEMWYKIYSEYIPKLTAYIETEISNGVRKDIDRRTKYKMRKEKEDMLENKYNEIYKL